MTETPRRTVRSRLRRGLVRLRRRIPPGYRGPAGVLLVIGGIFGFLPILGFWMIPLGVALIVMDVKSLRARSAPRPKPLEDTPSSP
ncbi:hypothetical protein [Pseudooceanicola algae]|uniref:hypothetical protein n=1 Tax=Pseudooceanicola algae TaxID=1537215 RepID=UPI000E6CAE9C|nr:hypothetical protein [Pseudooceanicola algae]